VHLLPHQEVRPVSEGLGKIFEHELDGLQGERVGVIRGKHRHVGFDGVGQNVQAHVRGYRRWYREGQLRIHDGH